jgi:DNA-binding NarL/FixJ family response regulator
VADDHLAVAEGLCAVLESEFDVIAAFSGGNALVAAITALTPDVIVTDIAMPGLDGIAAASEILQKHPMARIVFVTVHNDVELVQKGLATGALGYVLKLIAGEELIPAIHAALRGKQQVSPLIGRGNMQEGDERAE